MLRIAGTQEKIIVIPPYSAFVGNGTKLTNTIYR